MTTSPNPDDWLPVARLAWRSLYKTPALPAEGEALEQEAIRRLATAFGEWNRLQHTKIMRSMAELLTDVIEHHELILCEPGRSDACDAIRTILETFPPASPGAQ